MSSSFTDWLAGLWPRLKALARRRRFEEDLDEELRFHLEMRVQRLRERGLGESAAWSAARRRIGNTTLFREEARAMRTFPGVEGLSRDVALAARKLRREPAFSVLAVLILALGAGVNVAVFSVMDALLLKMLPVEEPGALFRMAAAQAPADDVAGGGCSLALFRTMKGRTRGLAELTAYQPAAQQTVTLPAGPGVEVYHQVVVGNFFRTLGVRAKAGRLLDEQDEGAPGASPVAVISAGLWKEGFGESTAALGSWITVDGRSFQITGVAPAGFFGVEVGKRVDVWTPVSMAPLETLRNDHTFWLRPLGRLARGVTVEQASAPVADVMHQFMLEDVRLHAPAGTPQTVIRRFLDDMRIRGVPAGGGVTSLRKEYRPALTAVMALALIVLLICCSNVANLLLARGAGRRPEIALRLSLGASRWRILRQLVTENLLLATMATTLGVLLARWVTPLFVHMLRPSSDAVDLSIPFDTHLAAFAALLALLTVLVSGLLPVIQLLRPELAPSLRGRAGTVDPASGRRQRFLVTAQVALSFVLVIGALLFGRTLTNLLSTPLGFEPAGVLTAHLSRPGPAATASAFPAAWAELLQRLQAEPGIQSAALSSAPLFQGEPPSMGFRTDARQPLPAPPTALVQFVSAGYFHTLRIALAQGRFLEERDLSPQAAPAVVVNRAFAAKFYGPEDALGHHVTRIADVPRWCQIVGVVKDVRVAKLRGPEPPIVYVPLTTMTGWLRPETRPGLEMTLLVRSGRPSPEFSALLRRLAGPSIRVANVAEQQQLVDDTLVRERLLARVAELFGTLCLLLAAAGLYAVMSYSIVQRRRDLSIRVALGASPGGILRFLAADAGRMILTGVLCGGAAAAVGGRSARALLFGLSPGDPAAYAAAGLLLLAAMSAAALIPVWRASGADPMEALRAE